MKYSLLCLLAACAADGYQHRASTGPRALSVEPELESVEDTQRSTLTDASGQPIATAETVVGHHTEISGYTLKLGADPVDERDFYHLAGDREAEDTIAASRSTGKLMNRIGLALVIGGTIATVAIPVALDDRHAAAYSVGQWFVSFPVGLALAAFGKARVEHHHFAAKRAFSAINAATPDWASR